MENIILLHGALGAASSMYSLSRALDKIAVVHVLDFSGHGESRWPEEAFSLSLFENDVLRFMKARDIESAYFFGYSLGGYVALKLAQNHAQRVKGIITLATKFDWTEVICKRESSMLDVDLLEEKAPRFIKSLIKIHQRNDWKIVVAATQEFLAEMHLQRFSASDFSTITTPVCLMVGDSDKMVSIQETMNAWHQLPTSEFAVLPGCNHPLEQVNKELLRILVERFLGEFPEIAL
ncbi:MAG: alpha/beta hydrolase [Chitinophagaceae bacterium]